MYSLVLFIKFEWLGFEEFGINYHSKVIANGVQA
jgi:hypothetical protein